MPNFAAAESDASPVIRTEKGATANIPVTFDSQIQTILEADGNNDLQSVLTWIKAGGNQDRLWHITRDLYANAPLPEFVLATEGDLAWVETTNTDFGAVPADITLTDAMFDSQGPDITVPGSGTPGVHRPTALYARMPIGATVSIERPELFRSNWTVLAYGGGWHQVTGPSPETYTYWFIEQASVGTSSGRAFLQSRDPVVRTRYVGDLGGAARALVDSCISWYDTLPDADDFPVGKLIYVPILGFHRLTLVAPGADGEFVADTAVGDIGFSNGPVGDVPGDMGRAINNPDDRISYIVAADFGTIPRALVVAVHKGDIEAAFGRAAQDGDQLAVTITGTDDDGAAVSETTVVDFRQETTWFWQGITHHDTQFLGPTQTETTLDKLGGDHPRFTVTIHRGASTSDPDLFTGSVGDKTWTGINGEVFSQMQDRLTELENTVKLKALDELPDPDAYKVEDIVAAANGFYELAITDEDEPNLFEATVGRSTIHLGSEHWRGVANSQSPNGFSTDGGWSSNPNNAISFIMASDGRHMRVAVKKSVYEGFKGSAFVTTDKLHMTLTLGSGDTDEVLLNYYSAYTRDTSYLIFQARRTGNSPYNLYEESAGNGMKATFRVGSDTGTLFTHAVSAKHWILWDQKSGSGDATAQEAYAKAVALEARLNALDAHVDGVDPVVTATYDDSNVVMNPAANRRTFKTVLDDAQQDDLVVVEWKNFHPYRTLWFDHIVPGSSDVRGRSYFNFRDVDSSPSDGELGYSTGRNRLVSDDSETFFSMFVDVVDSSGSLRIAFESSEATTAVDLKPPADFEIKVSVYRATPETALNSIHAEIRDLQNQIDDAEKDTDAKLRAFASHREAVVDALPDPTVVTAPEYAYLSRLWSDHEGDDGFEGVIHYSIGEYRKTVGDTADRMKVEFGSGTASVNGTERTFKGFYQRSGRLAHSGVTVGDFGTALHNPVGGAVPAFFFGHDPGNPLYQGASPSWVAWIKNDLANLGLNPWDLSTNQEAAQFYARIHYGTNQHIDVPLQVSITREVDGVVYHRAVCPSNPQPGTTWINALDTANEAARTVEIEFRTDDGARDRGLYLGGTVEGWTWVDPSEDPTAVARLDRMERAGLTQGALLAQLSTTGGNLDEAHWTVETAAAAAGVTTAATSSDGAWSRYLYLDCDAYAQGLSGSHGIIVVVLRSGAVVSSVFVPFCMFSTTWAADHEFFVGKWASGGGNGKVVWASCGVDSNRFHIRVACSSTDASSQVRIYRNN